MVALNFSPQFADAVAAGRKTQTIRQTARARAGQGLQLYTGQRTKSCRKLADAICVDCTYVGLTARGVTLGDASKFPGDIDDFARTDGFENYAAMWKWFSERYKTNSFTGHVIRWALSNGGALMTCYEQLSPLERERVDGEASETLYATFNAAHNAVGWSGDVMEECWGAGLPIMKEALARLVLRTR